MIKDYGWQSLPLARRQNHRISCTKCAAAHRATRFTGPCTWPVLSASETQGINVPYFFSELRIFKVSILKGTIKV